jgi:hypothetical protein
MLFFNPFSNAALFVKFVAAILALMAGAGAIYFGIILKEEDAAGE